MGPAVIRLRSPATIRTLRCWKDFRNGDHRESTETELRARRRADAGDHSDE